MEYFVAVLGDDGDYRFDVFCHNTYRGACQTAEVMAYDLSILLLFVGYYEPPLLEIVQPARGITRTNRWHGLAVRDHLMAGGSVSTSYGGRDYLITSEIFDSPIALSDSGNAVALDAEDVFEEAIGKCSIITAGVVLSEFHWESIDHAHCVDHLMSRFFTVVAKIEFMGVCQTS